mgnify:FL=1|jgi:hypothetical protein|tara:strand:- start:208 stop:516 length:309 start_codon:yes stop_codon:yes gene_type:complete
MQIKKGVILNGLNIKMRKVLTNANQVWALHGKELCVTAGLDGAHSAGSLHYYGLAVDLRTRYFSGEVKKQIVGELQRALGDKYDVVAHRTHIHCEYDPKEVI